MGAARRKKATCFRFSVNGEPPVTAGLVSGVTSLIANIVNRLDGTRAWTLHVGGLDSGLRAHVNWASRDLSPGDCVTFELTEGVPDEPASVKGEYSGEELARDRARSNEHWLAYWKRERAALDRQIAVAERAVKAERSKKRRT